MSIFTFLFATGLLLKGASMLLKFAYTRLGLKYDTEIVSVTEDDYTHPNDTPVIPIMRNELPFFEKNAMADSQNVKPLGKEIHMRTAI